jgi:hypothetical protein
LLLLFGNLSTAWAQAVTLETAVHELFGGRVVVGEVPDVVSSSIPLLDGVDVIAAHVDEGHFTVILSSKREAMSLLAEYAGVLTELRWRAVRTGPKQEEELSFCSPTDALIRVVPSIGSDGVKAKVAFDRESGSCKFGRAAAAALAAVNPAQRILTDVEVAPGCERPSGGGGSSGGDFVDWSLVTRCTVAVGDVAAHYAARWRQLGWVARVEDRTATQVLSAWQFADLDGRRWYAVFQVSSVGGEEPIRVLLNLSGSGTEGP